MHLSFKDSEKQPEKLLLLFFSVIMFGYVSLSVGFQKTQFF